MRRASFAWVIALSMVALAFAVALSAEITRSYRVSGAIGLALVGLFGGLLGWRLRREAGKLASTVQSLPELDLDGIPKHFREFDKVFDALEATSQRLQQRLGAIQADRLQLEALLDSMQDAVVAVDSAGRIQWTNQRMQRLIPGSSMASPVRVGHALVQTVRDPEVLTCVKEALEERSVSERRSTTLLPGRIFEVNASPMPGGGAVAVLHDITRIEQHRNRVCGDAARS